MFRLNRKIKDRCLNNDLLGRDIGKIEYEVQNKLNELCLNYKKCSYQIIINKCSWEVKICSRINVDDNGLKRLREEYYIQKGLKDLKKIESWGNFICNWNEVSKWDEKKYKLILFELKNNWKERKMIEVKSNNQYFNKFFVGMEELEDDSELFRELLWWKVFIKY